MSPYQIEKKKRKEERIAHLRKLYESGGLSLAAIGRAQTPPISRQRVFQLLRAK